MQPPQRGASLINSFHSAAEVTCTWDAKPIGLKPSFPTVIVILQTNILGLFNFLKGAGYQLCCHTFPCTNQIMMTFATMFVYDPVFFFQSNRIITHQHTPNAANWPIIEFLGVLFYCCALGNAYSTWRMCVCICMRTPLPSTPWRHRSVMTHDGACPSHRSQLFSNLSERLSSAHAIHLMDFLSDTSKAKTHR